MHGVSVTGVDEAELSSAQTFFLKLVGARGDSRSRSVSLAVHNDPTWRRGLAPALLRSKIMWESGVDHSASNPHPLPRLLSLAQPILTHPPGAWTQVRDPLGAAILSLARIGWSFHTPLVLRNPVGRRGPLTSFSPKWNSSSKHIGRSATPAPLRAN